MSVIYKAEVLICYFYRYHVVLLMTDEILDFYGALFQNTILLLAIPFLPFVVIPFPLKHVLPLLTYFFKNLLLSQ